jgi:hypothetical protein
MANLTQLFIRSVRKVLDFVPGRPCSDTLYLPCYLADPAPVLPGRNEVMCALGGHVDEPQTTGLASRQRFADKIYESFRLPDGSWSNPIEVVGKATFPWMDDEAFLIAHPETFIGSVASPSIVKVDDRYHMLFAASVSDPNICTGEHPTEPNVHGSCLVPWSYFVLYWATSDDGFTWTLRNMERQRTDGNVALEHAAVYYEPKPSETVPGAPFKGLISCSMLHDGEFFYITTTLWATVGLRDVMLRFDGVGGEFEVWDGGTTWVELDDGRLPEWTNIEEWRGRVVAKIPNQITTTTTIPGHRFLMTFQGSAVTDRGGSGINNRIEYACSNDLLTWTTEQVVTSEVPHVADGTGASNVILNPVYYEDAAGYHFLWASNDYNQDGQPDCDGPYPGLAIHQGDPTLPLPLPVPVVVPKPPRKRPVRRHAGTSSKA